MMDKRTIIISQLVMTFIMALTMSGIMSMIALGPTAEWLAIWPKQFIMAWPIAFVLTMIAWPLSMALTRLLVRPGSADHRS